MIETFVMEKLIRWSVILEHWKENTVSFNKRTIMADTSSPSSTVIIKVYMQRILRVSVIERVA